MKLNKKIYVSSQVISLVVALFAFSFFIASLPEISAAGPTIRNVPSGRSTSPYGDRVVEELSKMGIDDLIELYEQDNSGVSMGEAELNWADYIGLGVGSLTVITLVAKKSLWSSISSAFTSGSDGILSGGALQTTLGTAVSSFAGAFAGYAVARLIFSTFLSARNIEKIGTGGMIGIVAGSAIATLIMVEFGIIATGGPVGWIAGGIALIVTGIVYAVVAENYSRDVFIYSSGLWQPPTGGEKCLECNTLPYGCSEYQCRTYGASCALVNKDTEDEKCIWENPNDFAPPIVSTLDNLPSDKYTYEKTEQGYEIKYNNGCLPPFQGLTFGVSTDKYAQCRYGPIRELNFRDLPFGANFDSTSYVKEHKVTMPNTAFPSQYELTNLQEQTSVEINPDGTFAFYFLCRSRNGVVTPTHTSLEFCVETGPDLTAPEIIGSDPASGAYVKSGTNETEVNVYTSEPATCKWDFRNIAYNDMENEFESCSMNITDYKMGYYYGCTGEVDGIKPVGETNYFIRCSDKPSCDETILDEDGNQICKRIQNEQSYQLTLVGTEELVIDRIEINGLENGSMIESSSLPIQEKLKVYTSHGANGNGGAKCKYKQKDREVYLQFFNNGNFDFTSMNQENVLLSEGPNVLDILCCDQANNCAEEQVEYMVELDSSPPSILRVFGEGITTKFITDEPAKCVYDITGCNYLFENGTVISSYLVTEHTISNYEGMAYVKCEDRHGIRPVSDCTIKLMVSDK